MSHNLIKTESQTLGSEHGQYSDSMYLDLIAHTNQCGTEKIAAFLRIREYEQHYYFKRNKRKKLAVTETST